MAVSPKPQETAPHPLGVDNLGWLLWQASHVLKTQLTAALEEVGISPRAHHVLKQAMTGDFTQIQLAEAIGLDKTTMVVTLDELEKAGLAKRRACEKDRRARIVEVTEKGRKKVAKGEAIVERVQADVLGALAPEERTAFLEALCRLVSDPLSQPADCAEPVRRARM